LSNQLPRTIDSILVRDYYSGDNPLRAWDAITRGKH
jgi:hypothetical protein